MCAVSVSDEYGGGSACPGDSGSPLVTWDDGLTPVLIGIVSNGAPSCYKGLPLVFTEVAAYTEWIQNTMENHNNYDIQSEDSYLFHPYFTAQNIQQDPQIDPSIRIPRKKEFDSFHSFSFDKLLPDPQFETSIRKPRNLISKFLNFFGN